jgi:probable HAF family extracellular repeat protein
MIEKLTLLTGAAFVAIAAVQAAEPQVLVDPPHRFSAAPTLMRLAVRRHQTSARLDTVATAEDATFNAHVALWRSFDVPGALNGTEPHGINDLGEITGVYADSNNNLHGFVRKSGGEIVTFDPPNSTGTNPTAINNQGAIVGSYTDAAGATHGFIRSPRGKFTIIDDPSSTSSPPATYAQAINDWGVVVGYSNDSSSNNHGFVRQVDGELIPFEPPGAVSSQGYHINDLGEIGGDWSDPNTFHGMLQHPGGKVVTFDVPNATVTFGGLGQALNLEGSFAGTYADANFGTHGYIRYANGKFAEFTAPRGGTSNFNGTSSFSINLPGTVVGLSFEPDGSTIDGYVRFADGTLILANAPVAGQQSTGAWAINDLNQFTGFWVDAQGNEHGFVALAVP